MKFEIEIAGRVRKVEVEPPARGSAAWSVRIDGEPSTADAHLLRPGVLSLILDGRSHRIVLEGASAPDESTLHHGSRRIPYRIEDPRSLKSRRAHAGGADGPVTLHASMPGRVVRLLASAGDEVKHHQGVVVIEAMKMQNELKAPRGGRITRILVSAGDAVSAGQALAVIE
jgi:biotin carboxyl carrier protein